MITGGALVNKAREKDNQKIPTQYHLKSLRTLIMDTAHSVEKKSKVASVTAIFARAGTKKELAITITANNIVSSPRYLRNP